MILPRKAVFARFRPVLLALLGTLCLAPVVPLRAAPLQVPPAGSVETLDLPPELGEVVYRKNPGSPFQVFIIANSHRSSATGANGARTVQAQVETYRIGEWLIKRHQVELLLPEGFFGSRAKTGRSLDAAVLIDGPLLEEKLADTTTFVNADLLLYQNYGIGLHQVEDRELYGHIRELLLAGLEGGADRSSSFGFKLDYLQQLRSATILQNIPAAIEDEYRRGNIASPRAILTIGMAHLDEIIQFLDAGEVRIASPETGESGLPAYAEALELLKKGVGVTVIVPRAILGEREIMRMAKLETADADNH